MTDAEIRDAAVKSLEAALAHFEQTTKGYARMPQPIPPASQWGQGMADFDNGLELLAQIGTPELPPPTPEPVDTLNGVYVGARNVSGADAFKSWLGGNLQLAVDWHGYNSWGEIHGNWSLTPWKGKYVVSLAVQPWVNGIGGTLERWAAGEFLPHYDTLAKRIQADGMEDVIVRLAWELTGDWYAWHAGANPAAFKLGWQKTVDVMRAVVPGLRFDWNGTIGPKFDPATAYPGDAYVDFVGFDLYDEKWSGINDPAARWQDMRTRQYGINWWVNFAEAHGKSPSCPEWGLSNRMYNGQQMGGLDNPYFISAMADLFEQHNFGYQAYFNVNADDGSHHLDQFPQSKARYQERF